ncbi:MAG: alanyl-tRNA editing protein [Clostridia bacterium]|nr:alanyl-tRNA editing protein [Clostridia bacterium]
MSEKLYYIDSHAFEFDARVLSCERNGKGQFETELDRTAFFPEGGGQYGDCGFIGEVYIYDTRTKDSRIVHISDKPLTIGQEYHCKLDKKQRFRNMQHHSGEHILSGLFHRLYGYNNIGFHLGKDRVTIDIDANLHEEEIRTVELSANEAVYKNVPVKTYFPTKEELSKINYRSKKEIADDLRIVEIEGYDVCACCAPHVNYTGEIGAILISDYIKYKSGTRITIKCGYDALGDYTEKNAVLKSIGQALSSPPEKAYEALERLISERDRLKEETEKANRSVADFLIEKELGNRIICIFGNFDRQTMIYGADKSANESEISFFFSGDDSEEYIFVISSVRHDLLEIKSDMSKTLDVRGGGNAQRISGTIKSGKKEICEYINSLREKWKD